MSSYFDSAAANVLGDFTSIVTVEDQVIKDVSAISDDREFPDDLRVKILGAISLLRYDNGPEKPATAGRRNSDLMRRSALIERLHDIFHTLAQRRVETRFGMLSDRPNGMLARREEWERSHRG